MMSAPACFRLPRLALCALVAVVSLALAGCGAVSASVKTAEELRNAGIPSPSVLVETLNGVTTVEVKYDSARPAGEVPPEVVRVQRIVWTTMAVKFDVLEVTATPQGDASFPTESRAEYETLESAFGPRSAELDKDPSSIGRGGIIALLVVGAVGLVFFGLLVFLVVWLVRRSRRRNPPPGYGSPPGPYGQAQQPGPPPSWH